MGVIGRYILKNIFEKKLRTILLVLSIAVSSALFFASSSISDTLLKMQADKWRGSLGYTDIIIQPWWESPSRYFSKEDMKELESNFQYTVGTVSGYGIYKESNDKKQGVNLWGIDYEDLNKIVKMDLKEAASLYPFDGMKIVISDFTAKKYSLHAGDSMLLEINGARHKFLISGVAAAKGPFIGEGDTISGIVPPDTIRSLYNVRGKIDALYLKLKDPANKEALMSLLQQKYPLYNVKEPFTEKEIRAQNDKIRIPFLALTIILSFMSIYIINSSFKVITLERLSDIGTFRSLGAEKKKTNRLLLIESLIYGLFGGAAGCILGIIVLYLMSILTMPVGDGSYRAGIAFRPEMLLYTFLMSVLLCVVSSTMPIMRANKAAIRELIMQSGEGVKTSRIFRGVTGFLLLGVGILAPVFVKGKNAAYIDALCVVAVIAAVVMIMPFIMAVILRAAEKIYYVIFGNEGIIALKNLRKNSSIIGSISLLAIGMSCMLFVDTISYSTLKGVSDYYDRANYEIFMQAQNVNPAFMQAIRSTEGVKDVYKVLGIGGIEIVNKGDVIGLTHGIETERFLQYNNLKLSGNRQKTIDMLDKGRNILITNRLRERYNLTIGDKLTLRAWGRMSDYIVIGFFDSLENSGDYAIISSKYMKLDMGWKDSFYSTVYIKTSSDAESTLNNLKARFAKQRPFMNTMAELKKENMQSNEQIFLIAKGFSLMTILAGILGIFNNLLINFIQRRRQLAMYRSIGMSKRQLIKMIFVEAFTVGIVGSITGVLAGIMLVFSGAGLLKVLNIPVNIQFSAASLVLYLVAGLVIALAATVGPALKSSRLNLAEAVKYE